MELPFELNDKHKSRTKARWKYNGLNMDNFEEIYSKYIVATHCELCNKKFPDTQDRSMDHNHATGEFRNIVCNRCNQLKEDVKISSDNTSGYKGITKQYDITYKQGYRWVFKANIDRKTKTIKSSVNKEKLIEFANKWKKDNNYHT
jgi:hypothetical protein